MLLVVIIAIAIIVFYKVINPKEIQDIHNNNDSGSTNHNPGTIDHFSHNNSSSTIWDSPPESNSGHNHTAFDGNHHRHDHSSSHETSHDFGSNDSSNSSDSWSSSDSASSDSSSSPSSSND